MISPPNTSVSPLRTAPRWDGSWPTAPRLVAESLIAVADPLRTSLAAGPAASGAEGVRALVRALVPSEHAGRPPPWLLPGQARSFRRAMAALERYRGALL